MTSFSSLKISEHDIQANFIREAGYEFRNDPTFLPELLYSVLNGAWISGEKGSDRKKGLLKKYIDEGWKAGIPDVHYDQPRGDYSKLVIEFKRTDRRNEKNGGLSNEQLAYMNAIAPYALVKVCYSTDEAMEALREYMALPDKYHKLRKQYNLCLFHAQFKHDKEKCLVCVKCIVESLEETR